MSTFRLALDPPPGPLTVIDDTLLDRAVEAARQSPRGRMIVPFHKSADELLNRMLNAVEPHSYVRPHRHLMPPKDEAWILLRGSLVFFTFEDDGQVRDVLELEAGSSRFGVDLGPGVYHTFIAQSSGTVIFEVKTGPYRSADDKAFAPFAPAEFAPEVPAYMAQLMATYRARAAR